MSVLNVASQSFCFSLSVFSFLSVKTKPEGRKINIKVSWKLFDDEVSSSVKASGAIASVNRFVADNYVNSLLTKP